MIVWRDFFYWKSWLQIAWINDEIFVMMTDFIVFKSTDSDDIWASSDVFVCIVVSATDVLALNWGYGGSGCMASIVL